MRNSPMRGTVHKARSARTFKHQVGRTDRKNVQMAPRRGGWRL